MTLADPIPASIDVPVVAPCASCGVGVAGPFERDDLDVLTVATRDGRAEADIIMTRCSTCRSIYEAARGLVMAHPSVRAAIGSPSVAAHRLELALVALDYLGIRDPRVIDNLTDTAGDLRRLLTFMTIPGGGLRWAARFVGPDARSAARAQANREPWQHVTAADRAAVQRAWVHMYADRTEKPTEYVCPPDEDGHPSGCMLCGVASVTALPSQERAAGGLWTVIEGVDPSALGGSGPETVDGHVCPACDNAIDAAGGIGQGAMRRAVLGHLGVPWHDRTVGEVDGLRGWSTLGAGAQPNREPWGHVYLERLREATRRLVEASARS